MAAAMTEQRTYLAYMLRLWQVNTNGEVVWHVSIEDPHTGERHGFANLDRLFEFLERQTRELDQIQATALAAARPAVRPENRQPPRKVPSRAL